MKFIQKLLRKILFFIVPEPIVVLYIGGSLSSLEDYSNHIKELGYSKVFIFSDGEFKGEERVEIHSMFKTDPEIEKELLELLKSNQNVNTSNTD